MGLGLSHGGWRSLELHGMTFVRFFFGGGFSTLFVFLCSTVSPGINKKPVYNTLIPKGLLEGMFRSVSE